MVTGLKPVELPIDLDNEALILANAIKEEANRLLFVRRVNYLDFRYKENQVIAWSIQQLSMKDLEVNIDGILLVSKTCPVGYQVDFEFIQKVVENYPSVPSSNYENHLDKLHLDKTKSQLAQEFFKSIYTACLDPSTDLTMLTQRLESINQILKRDYSFSRSQFKSMREIVDEYKEYQNTEHQFRSTGFRQLDELLTDGFKQGGITIICGLPGMGKCHVADTMILMQDGTLKPVQDVQVNDLVRGIDGKPRRVLSTHIAYGTVYKITQDGGVTYCVNGEHLLYVQNHKGVRYTISTKDLLKSDKLIKNEVFGCRKLSFDTDVIVPTQLSISTEGEDIFYGFELDKDHLYCLEDLTICHNSSWTLSSMYNLNNIGVFCPQFALEMDNMSITTKLASFASRIPVIKISKDFKNLSVDEKALLEYELERLASSKYLYFNDTPGQSLATIREQILILQERLDTDYMFVTVDLFGKISDFQSSDNFASDYEKKLNQVQYMAKELRVNFGLVAQIRRTVNDRRFNRPKMSDIKNAGAWEEVADLILAIHRPYYDPEVALKKEIARNAASGMGNSFEEEHDPNENLAELIILKQRMGKTNLLVNFYFDHETTRYSPISSEYQDIVNQQKFEDLDDE